MKTYSLAFTLITGMLFFCGCKKDNKQTEDCFQNLNTYRQVENKLATIKQQSNGLFYMVEQGAIDTKLNPCNLPLEFQNNNLQVTISGNVKSTAQNGVDPCCTEIFVITKITN